MSEYEKQAEEFLRRFGLRFRAVERNEKEPEWAEGGRFGNHYRVTISRRGDYVGNEGLTPKRISFDFWGSLADQQSGEDITAYDVLANISGDIYCPDDFEEFCSEYGYEEDSRKAEATFRRVATFSRRLREFFTPAEQKALSEIT
jgi:hypothetical protein